MEVENYEIFTTGGLMLKATCWKPLDPIALIFILHGLGEDSAQYEEMAKYFTSQQMAVFIYDQRGHGQSEGKKGHARSMEQLIEDMEHALMYARSCYIDLPIFVIGHNTGGNIITNYLLRLKSRELNGVILFSPWLQPNLNLSFKQKLLLRSIGKLFFKYRISLALGENGSTKKTISFALLKALKQSDNFLLNDLYKGQVPLLVNLYERDNFVPLGAAEQLSKNFCMVSSTLKVWPKSEHFPHIGTNIFEYFTVWIKDILHK